MKKKYLFFVTILTVFATTTANAATVVRENVVSIPEDQKVKPINPATYETQDQNQGNNNNQSSDDTINKDSNNQNNSDQTTPDQGQKTDEENNSQSQDANSESWLEYNGIAKVPSYSITGTELVRPFSDPAKGEIFRSAIADRSAEYPEINPATGKPLWDTQPFWREDGSFDLVGYFRQFSPTFEGEQASIKVDSIFVKGQETVGSNMALHLTPVKYLWAADAGYRQHAYLNISLTKDNFTWFRLDKPVVQVMNINAVRWLPNGKVVSNNRIGYLKRSEMTPQNRVRITGSQEHYLYSPEIPLLEKIMRNYIKDPEGNGFRNHYVQMEFADGTSLVFESPWIHDRPQ